MLKYIVLFAVCVVETFVMGGVPPPHFNWYAGTYNENHATSISSAVPDIKCKGVFFDNKYYDKQILHKGLKNIRQIIYNTRDEHLYFIFDKKVPRGLISVVGYFDTEIIRNVKHTADIGLVEGIRNPTCIAIDQAETFNNVYIGGPDGLYVLINFSIIEKRFIKVPERLPVEDNIKSMYFLNHALVYNTRGTNEVLYKNVLYYTNSRKQLYILDKERNINLVSELEGVYVDNFILSVISDHDTYRQENIYYDIFFTQQKKLIKGKMGSEDPESRFFTFDMYSPNFLFTDLSHTPYICTNDGVYMFNYQVYGNEHGKETSFSRFLSKVSNISHIKAITFFYDHQHTDNGEPIYVVDDKIVHLKRNLDTKCDLTDLERNRLKFQRTCLYC